jgi:hypothetical protein
MEIRSLLRGLFSIRILVGALAVAILLFIATLGLMFWTRPEPAPAGLGTAVLHIIRAPTGTPLPTATLQVTATPPSSQPVQGEIAINSFVQVSGTSGEGLRLRSDAGLNNQILLLGTEGEIFQVREGPKEADGYTWWYLVSPQDEGRHGWAVANFLQLVTSQ